MLRDGSRYTGDFKRTVKLAGLNVRQAYYLCEIVDRLRGFARYKERFEAIGWTKTQVIARGINRQNLKGRLELAEAKGNSTRKLQSLMKGETPAYETRRVVLYFTDDDYGVFEKAVLHNGGSTARRGNLVDKELALIALIKKAAPQERRIVDGFAGNCTLAGSRDYAAVANAQLSVNSAPRRPL